MGLQVKWLIITKGKPMGQLHLQMELFILVSFLMGLKMVMVSKSGKMDPNMMVNGREIKPMVKVH